MKRILHQSLIAFLAGFLLLSSNACDNLNDRFEEINTNPNQTDAARPDDLLPYIQNGISAHRFESWRGNLLYAMQFGCQMSSPWLGGVEFQSVRDDWTQGYWDRSYVRLVGNLQQVYTLAELEASGNMAEKLAIADIMKVLIFHRLTDFWGDVPYFEAGRGLEGTVNPTFDPQEEIYKDFFQKLEAATATLNASAYDNVYGDQDLFYGGNVEGWIRLANSLRLRLALRVSEVDPALANAQASAVLNQPLIDGNDWNCFMFHFDDGSQWTTQGKGMAKPQQVFDAHRLSKAAQDFMQHDPRLPLFAAPNANGEYKGAPSGTLPEGMATDWAEISPLNADGYFGTDEEAMFVSAAEVYFLRAEAAIRGIGRTQSVADAQSLYETGVATSLARFGVSSTPEFEASIAFESTDIAVGYDQIMRQKWVCLFGDGYEAWAELRRSGHPKFEDDQVYGNIPRRSKYPSIVQTLNPVGYQTAISQQGDDVEATRMWWDAK